MTTDDHAAYGGPPAYRPLVPVLAVGASLSAVIGDSGSASANTVVLAAVVPFVVWLVRPRLPALVVVGLTVVAVLFATRNSELEASMFLLSIAATVVGGYEASPTRLAIGGAALVAVPLVSTTFLDNQTATAIWVMGVVLPLVLSRVERRQLELAAELATTRADLADQRVLEERRRIARDVHDSVGHGLAAVLLHITGARHVLRRDQDAADQALADAEEVGRRSMRELRETLGLLRTETPEGPMPPVPGLSEVAGDEVWSRFTVTGDIARISPLTAMSLHRVAEEAFANAHRHAPEARIDALLDVRRDDVVMTIESFGRKLGSPGQSLEGAAQSLDQSLAQSLEGAERRPRYGIVGMSERMAAVGGTIDVGPTPSGWLVRASVPLRPVDTSVAS